MLAPKQVSPTYINIYFNEISLYRVSALTVLSVRPLTFFTVVCAADSLLFNKIDERLRLARERREEREKQNGERSCEFDREKNKSYLFLGVFFVFPTTYCDWTWLVAVVKCQFLWLLHKG